MPPTTTTPDATTRVDAAFARLEAALSGARAAGALGPTPSAFTARRAATARGALEAAAARAEAARVPRRGPRLPAAAQGGEEESDDDEASDAPPATHDARLQSLTQELDALRAAVSELAVGRQPGARPSPSPRRAACRAIQPRVTPVASSAALVSSSAASTPRARAAPRETPPAPHRRATPRGKLPAAVWDAAPRPLAPRPAGVQRALESGWR